MRTAGWIAPALLWLLFAAGASASNDDPGLVLELDRDRYRVRAVDLRSEAVGPEIEVGLGSPANPTPDGRHRVGWVVMRPSWSPAPGAYAAGARKMPPSLNSPMGVAKIPFAENGAVALHGGGDPRILGQPISAGCVRASDGDLLRLIAWLDLVGALGPPIPEDPQDPSIGEVRRTLQRPTYVVIR